MFKDIENIITKKIKELTEKKDKHKESFEKLSTEELLIKENRVIINEWRNFIDYDILPLIKKIIEGNNEIQK